MLKENLLLLLAKFNVDGFITTMQDEHLNEFVNDNDNRIQTLTGFTGTSGTAYTSPTVRAFITDGRYHVQATKELKEYSLVKETETDAFWKQIAETAKKVGIDSKFIGYERFLRLRDKLKTLGIKLIHMPDPVIETWKDRKPREFKEIINIEEYKYEEDANIDEIMAALDECGEKRDNKKISGILNSQIFDNQLIRSIDEKGGLAGETKESKLKRVLEIISRDEVIILTELDTIAWLFNHRGQDIKNNLFFFAFAIISHSRIILFANQSIKGIETRKYEEFYDFIEKEYAGKKTRIVVSRNTSAFIVKKFQNVRISDEIRKLQSIKNKTELYGMFRSNVHDAISFIKLAVWLKKHHPTEDGISRRLERFRKEDCEYLRASFRSIVAIGPNAAEPHHTAGKTVVEDNKMVLLDTGSHYPFGSTDITRTLYIGRDVENEEMKRAYTLVLRGAVAPRLERAKVLTGDWVDRKARGVIKSAGMDYESSTGHGVGFGLSIHEWPPTVFARGGEILERQVFTIEPGVYKEGKYGIRIEDMVYMENGRLFDLTVIPYERRMIDSEELSEKEKKYLNRRGRQMRCLLKGVLKGNALEYLFFNTNEI